MKIKLSASALLAAALVACTSGPIHLAIIDSTVQLYAAAIRFGEFEKAQEFVDPAKRTRLDLAWLKNIHISSYDIVHRKENLGGNIYEMTVQIHYFIESEGVEKSVTDRQIWRYDEGQRKMMLETSLPEFR
jgi:hypothetical protein